MILAVFQRKISHIRYQIPYNGATGLARYDAKRGCGISVVDPGAVPGSSTILALLGQYCGAETGSTRVVKASFGVRCFRRYRINLIVANDNSQFVAANDNSVVSEAIAA